MTFTFKYAQLFVLDLFYAAPILIFLFSLIIIIGLIVSKIEGWSIFDGIYHAFINATTLGYGDFRPTKPLTKALAIALAMTGLVFTGMVVAIALHAATYAFSEAYKTS